VGDDDHGDDAGVGGGEDVVAVDQSPLVAARGSSELVGVVGDEGRIFSKNVLLRYFHCVMVYGAVEGWDEPSPIS
jgi:hypothetical protein